MNNSTPNNINHIAFCTGNMKEQLDFYTKVVGMELKALFWMHGVEGAFHAFLQLSPNCCISFVYHPDVEKMQPVMGVSHVANTISLLPGGAHQHMAFNMNSVDEVKAIVERIRRFGYMVSEVIDHDFCQSAYMLAPENVWIEFTTTVRDFESKDIDAEVVRLCDISENELAKMMAPNSEVKADAADLEKGKAQRKVMKQRMVEMFEQMQAKGKTEFDTQYKH